MEQVERGKWNWKLPRMEWTEVLFWVVMPILLVGLVWSFIYEFDKHKKEKQAHAVLVEQTSFEVSGTVEVARESTTLTKKKGLLGEWDETSGRSYVTVDGTEYRISDDLDVSLHSGQNVIIKGYDGTVREISILK